MAVTLDLKYDPEAVARGMKRAADAMLETSRAADQLGKASVQAGKDLDAVGQSADKSAKAVTNLKQSVGDLWRQSREDLRKLREEFQATEREAKKAAQAMSDPSFEGGFGMNQAQWGKAIQRRDAIAKARAGRGGAFDDGGKALLGAGTGAIGGAVLSQTGSPMMAGAAEAVVARMVTPAMEALAASVMKASVAIGSVYAIYKSVQSIGANLADPNHIRSAPGRAVAGMWGYGDTVAAEGKDVAYFSKARQSNQLRANPENEAYLASINKQEALGIAAKEQMGLLKSVRAGAAWESGLAATVGSIGSSADAKRHMDDLLKTQDRLAKEGKLDGERALRTEKEMLALKTRHAQLVDQEAHQTKEYVQWVMDIRQAERDRLDTMREQRKVRADMIREEAAAWKEQEKQRNAERVEKFDQQRAGIMERVGAAEEASGGPGSVGQRIVGMIPEDKLQRRTGRRKREYRDEAERHYRTERERETEAGLREVEGKFGWRPGMGGGAGGKDLPAPEGYWEARRGVVSGARRKEREGNRRARKEIQQQEGAIEQDVQYEMANEMVTNAVKQGDINTETGQAFRAALQVAQQQQQQLDQAKADIETVKNGFDALKDPGSRRKNQVSGFN